MVSPTPRNSSNHKDNEEENSGSLIPGLPNDVAELCLLYLPYPYQALVRSVSSSWNRVIKDPSFVISRKALSLSRPYLFVLAVHKSTAVIQWQVFDPQSTRWFILPPMPCKKEICPTSFACVSMPRQGKLYVLGGMGSDTETSMDTALVYDGMVNQWSFMSPMINSRSFFVAGCIGGGRILAVGGCGSRISECIQDVECYDVENAKWAPVAQLRTGLAKDDSAVVGNRMYVTEGWTWPFLFPPRGGVYDMERDTWQEMSDGMKEGWTGLSVVLEGKIFVISEHGDCPMKVYLPDLDTWRYVGGEKFPREAMQRPFAVSGVEGRVYVVSSGLNVAIGRVYEGNTGEFLVKWALVLAPRAFREFSPCNSLVLYA